MKQNITTKQYFLSTLLFVAAFVFLGGGAPKVEAYTWGGITESLAPTYISGFSTGGSWYANQKVGSGDLSVCPTTGSLWGLIKSPVFGPTTVGLFGENDLEITSASLQAQGTGAVPNFSSIASSYGDGNYIFFSNNMTGCSGYPITFISQGSGFSAFNITSGVVTQWDIFSGTPTVTINTPIDTQTVADFNNWNIAWNEVGTSVHQLGIHYSDDLTTLTACEEFPYGVTAGYTDCINSSPRIWTDYGVATTVGSGSANITKALPLTLGTTYYAQAVIQDTNSYGTNITVSGIISFTIGIPTGTQVDASSCGTFDIICYIQAGANWLFVPSQESLDNFKNLTLQNSFPFSYLYDMPVLYDDAFNHSAQSITISIPWGSHTFTLLSTSMLEAISFQSLVRTIMGALCIFMTALFLYHKILKVHDQGHKTA